MIGAESMDSNLKIPAHQTEIAKHCASSARAPLPRLDAQRTFQAHTRSLSSNHEHRVREQDNSCVFFSPSFRSCSFIYSLTLSPGSCQPFCQPASERPCLLACQLAIILNGFFPCKHRRTHSADRIIFKPSDSSRRPQGPHPPARNHPAPVNIHLQLHHHRTRHRPLPF